MMNKEREALLNKVLADAKLPTQILPKSIERFLNRMNPDDEMREYLRDYFSAETHEERKTIEKKKYSSMSQVAQADFSLRFLKCVQTELNSVSLTA